VETLEKLSHVLVETGASTLFLLGDFWHSKEGRTDRIHSILYEWRLRHAGLEITLIEGNHDRRAGAMPSSLDIREVPELLIDGFLLKHHPEEDERGYVLCGHIHPAVRMIGQGRQVAKLPAFWFGARVGVLPAFGEFTGDATVYPDPGDRVFVICEDEVQEVGLTGAGVM
jgi:DNA ligase-associated metallophosphoesterase